MNPVTLPGRYRHELARFIKEEPIALAFRTGMEHLAKYTTNAQMGRFQHQMAILFQALDQNASWRQTGRRPAVWEYYWAPLSQKLSAADDPRRRDRRL